PGASLGNSAAIGQIQRLAQRRGQSYTHGVGGGSGRRGAKDSRGGSPKSSIMILLDTDHLTLLSYPENARCQALITPSFRTSRWGVPTIHLGRFMCLLAVRLKSNGTAGG